MLNLLRAGSDTLREVLLYFVGLTLVAGGAFSYFESISYFDGYYWANVTASSTGYGDITPKTVGGKITAILTMLAGLIIYAMVIYRVIELLAPDRHEFTHEEQDKMFTVLDDMQKQISELSSERSKS